ncbi:MAG: DUF4923 family protein [Bacteroidales bacterium]|nr:DUF4923 family protein [Bacteroidales bacterium]
MKKIALITVTMLLMSFSANAQLGGLLGKLGQMAGGSGSSDSKVGSLVSSITDLISGKAGLSVETISGNWNYTGSAISFKSEENLLSNLGSSLATGTIEKKLDGYLSKVGISEGLFGFVFKEDGTMTVKYGSKTFGGTWTLDEKNAMVNMKVAKLINMKAYVAVQGAQMELLFDVTTLMRLVKSLTSTYNNATLQTLNSLLNQYDKMYAGFKLKK